jgi:hypothetical protein
MTKQEVLQQCTVQGNNVYLPAGQLDRKLYQDVAKALELIGGKWKGGKIFGFVFQSDPTDLLSQIANGEKRNLKKEYQFFGTPKAVATMMVGNLNGFYSSKSKFLEPSAGQGALVDAFRSAFPDHDDSRKTLVELMPMNCSILQKKNYGCKLLEQDFLTMDTKEDYNIILANPPFTKNQDIDHIRKMYDVLNPCDGIMVTLCSPHFMYASGKKETAFKEWLKQKKAQLSIIPAGAFKESGTNIETILIVIDTYPF